MRTKCPPVRVNELLVPQGAHDLGAGPGVPLLIIPARRHGFFSTISVGSKPGVPKWISIERIEGWLEVGAAKVEEFVPTLHRLEDLTPGALEEYRARSAAMAALLEDNNGNCELLSNPNDFNRICSEYARAQGVGRKWVTKCAWMWLKNGRGPTALVGGRLNSGGPGKPRNFTEKVAGPKQKNGVEYEVLAASPYSHEQRAQIKSVIEALWKKGGRNKDFSEFVVLARGAIDGLGLPPPSLAQVEYFLKDYRERARLAASTGLLHIRYQGRYFATQCGEVDSTKLQAFAKSEIDSSVLHKGPTYYKCIDVGSGYVGAILVSFAGASPALLADLLFRAMVGMADICKDYGLPYGDAEFPAVPPFHSLWADNQELLGRKLETTLLRHIGTRVALTIVAKGADKGKIEESLGHDKKKMPQRSDAFFPKGSVGKALEKARKGTSLDLRLLEAELINLVYERNHAELPIDKLPAEFLKTGRPRSRVELFKWGLEEAHELVKPKLTREQAAMMILPSAYYPVHVGMGVYVNGLYYSCPELVEAGILRHQAKGPTPHIEVAHHEGSAGFVYWIRGPKDVVKCNLIGKLQQVYGEMTMHEAAEHQNSVPSLKKRKLLKAVNSAAHQKSTSSKSERNVLSKAGKTAHITKDKNRINAARKFERNLDSKRRSDKRFAPESNGEAHAPLTEPHFNLENHESTQMNEVMKMIDAKRRENSSGNA